MEMLHIPCNVGEISDGYHTFNELYEHRCHLFAALMLNCPELSWKSKLHDDGTMFSNWFVAGMHLPTGDITYHLPGSMWTTLGGITTLEKAPHWDGHTPDTVVRRLEAWCKR